MICDETFVAIAEAAVLKDLDFVKKATVQKKTKRCSAHSSQNDCGTWRFSCFFFEKECQFSDFHDFCNSWDVANILLQKKKHDKIEFARSHFC